MSKEAQESQQIVQILHYKGFSIGNGMLLLHLSMCFENIGALYAYVIFFEIHL